MEKEVLRRPDPQTSDLFYSVPFNSDALSATFFTHTQCETWLAWLLM